MCSTTRVVLCFTLLNVLVQIRCGGDLLSANDYDIFLSEWILRNTVNNLFSTLKLKDINLKQNLKQYSRVHNFFVSVTLQNHDNLKVITRLAKVDNVDNSTQVFITQLNEVLNEDNKSDEETDAVYVTTLIEEFLNRLDQLKETHGLKNNTNNLNINEDVLKHLSNDVDEIENVTESNSRNESSDTLLSDTEFWQSSGRRIFKGKSVKIQRFPFMASVNFFMKFQCAGSIIKSDLIITSASCLQLAWNNRFFRENPSFLSVNVGSQYFEYKGENIPIMEIKFHPNYDPKNLRHNLAIMRTERALSMDDKKKRKVKKIAVDNRPWALPSSTKDIIIVGWGAKDMNSNNLLPTRNKLSYAILEYYSLTECQEIYSKEYVTDRNFCAGFITKGSGACNRDAGGPGVFHDTLIGVVSFGAPLCGTPDAPTVFTKLGYYYDWINSIMLENPAERLITTTERPPKITTHHVYTPEHPSDTTIPFKVTPPPIDKTTYKYQDEPEEPPPPTSPYKRKTKSTTHNFEEFMSTIFTSKSDESSVSKEKKPKKKIKKKKKKSKKILREGEQHQTEDQMKEKENVKKKENPKSTPKASKPKINKNKPNHKKDHRVASIHDDDPSTVERFESSSEETAAETATETSNSIKQELYEDTQSSDENITEKDFDDETSSNEKDIDQVVQHIVENLDDEILVSDEIAFDEYNENLPEKAKSKANVRNSQKANVENNEEDEEESSENIEKSDAVEDESATDESEETVPENSQADTEGDGAEDDENEDIEAYENENEDDNENEDNKANENEDYEANENEDNEQNQNNKNEENDANEDNEANENENNEDENEDNEANENEDNEADETEEYEDSEEDEDDVETDDSEYKVMKSLANPSKRKNLKDYNSKDLLRILIKSGDIYKLLNKAEGGARKKAKRS